MFVQWIERHLYFYDKKLRNCFSEIVANLGDKNTLIKE